MATKKEQPIVILTHTGAGTMNILADHGLERIEKGQGSGSLAVDKTTINPSSPKNEVYLESLAYVLPGGEKGYAVLVDAQEAKDKKVTVLKEVASLDIVLRDQPKRSTRGKK